MKLDKKIVISILISVISIGLIIGCFCLIWGKKDVQKFKPSNDADISEKPVDQNSKNENEPIIKLIDELDFEINSELNLLSLVSDANTLEIVSEDEKIDTSVLGEKEVALKYIDEDGSEKEYIFKINIIDRAAPTIQYNKEITTTLGTTIDLLKGVEAKDNSNEQISVSIDGIYDFNKVGEYNLKYVAIDSSNNKIEGNFILKVEKKQDSPKPNNVTKPTAGDNQSGTKPTVSDNQSGTKPTVNDNQNDTKPIINDNQSSTNPSTDTSQKDEQTNSNSPTNSDVIIEKKYTKDELIKSNSKKYMLNYNFSYAKQTDDFYAKNKNQIVNIIYTALNEGSNNFSFYCDYDKCIEDFKSILYNEDVFNNLSNFIHPFNTLNSYQFSFKGNLITVTGTKTYSSSEIAQIESKVNSVINEITNGSMTKREKVIAIHNYIVNNTKYLNNNKSSQYKASGPLLYGESVCEGYSHAMAIFLNKLSIPNYRISSPTHQWNLAYIDNGWYHIDVTWDDPIVSDAAGNPTGQDILRDDYLFITTSKLQSLDTGNDHKFNKSIYIEAK